LPCVHIHSGADIPSHGTMLYELIRDIPPDRVGAYVDSLHMALEGGGDGWRQGLDLLAPWISLVAIKNFLWVQKDRDKGGQMQWEHKVVPIADGVSPMPQFVATVKSTGYKGVYSLHSEYKGKSSFKDLDTDACLKQTEVDLKYLRTLLK
jgi:L-ribulose-5-phosphate 3-epimerase